MACYLDKSCKSCFILLREPLKIAKDNFFRRLTRIGNTMNADNFLSITGFKSAFISPFNLRLSADATILNY